MCCRRFQGYMSYQHALSEAVHDKLPGCYWIRHVIHFLIVSSLWTYHFAMICYDYMSVCELVGESVLNLKQGSLPATRYVKTIVLIPHVIVFSLGRLKNLGFASFLALAYFAICKFSIYRITFYALTFNLILVFNEVILHCLDTLKLT